MKNKKVSLGKLSSFSYGIRKKGISAIIATVLIILITVAAVTIIWAAIIPMIQNTIEGSQECFDASASLSVITDYSCVAHYECTNRSDSCQEDEDACISPTGNCNLTVTQVAAWTGNGVISVQVKRGTGSFVLSEVEIITGAGGTTFSNTTEEDDLDRAVPDVNAEKVYDVEYTGDKRKEAGVAAWVEAGNTIKVCDRSGMIQISDCA